MDIQFTGERVVPEKMDNKIWILQEHLARYNFAIGILDQFKSKTVLDAACGSGYGSMLLSLSGKDVCGVDIDYDSIYYAKDKFRSFCKYDVVDLDNIGNNIDKKFDAIVSFETIEHLENPDKFINWVKGKTDLFIFSIPINQPSEFHKHVYSVEQAVELIKKHFNNYTFLSQIYMNIYNLDNNAKYIVGYAKNN